MPLISVIIPTKNRKNLLLDAVKSVLNQTYKNIQLVVHDNNSTDGTKEYILSNINDPRMEFYKVSKNLTMTENWNKAFGYIKGNYFIRLDDDNVFFNDFIESAIKEINKLNLTTITFSPLIIHLNNKLYSLFDKENEEKTYILNKYQSTYLEYFTLTDSNYTLYDTAVIKNLFPDGNIYQATLPDRYMNYRIAINAQKLNLKIGINAKIKGATRFDYRPPLTPNFLKYFNYGKIKKSEITQEDCHNNFYAHRIITFSQCLNNTKDDDLKDFFEKHILNHRAYAASMRLWHVYAIESAYSLQELFVLEKYALSIILFLLKNRGAKIAEKKSSLSFWPFLKRSVKITIISLKNIITKRQRKFNEINTTLGDEIIKKIIKNNTINNYKIIALYGKLSDIIREIDKKINSNF